MAYNAQATANHGEIVIYQTPDGAATLDVRLRRDTVWLSQQQMAELFDRDSDTIRLHIRNVYDEGELDEPSTTEDSSVVQIEGGRRVRRTVRDDCPKAFPRAIRFMAEGGDSLCGCPMSTAWSYSPFLSIGPYPFSPTHSGTES